MDNATHCLAAVLAAEAVCQVEQVRSDCPYAARFRNAALWVSLLANNLPDLDFTAGIRTRSSSRWRSGSSRSRWSSVL
jgi:hypothetical protein